MRKTLVLLFTVLFVTPQVYAQYVLPYPSYMPGNTLYRISRIADILKAYWYWGSIASFRYHLGLADKYLVEAKTLFEYKQYLLASDAMNRSNEHFQKLPLYMKRAVGEHKDVTILKRTAKEAALEHIRIMENISASTPEEFIWLPEKSQASTIPIGRNIREGIDIRQSVSEFLSEL